METHFLKLAYLAEIAIVFSLAYLELKWQRELEQLMERLDIYNNGQFARSREQVICKRKNCDKCDIEMAEFMKKYNITHIQGILKDMADFRVDGFSIPPTKAIAKRIWEMSNHPKNKEYSDFYYNVGQGKDKAACRWSLIISTITLFVITSFDIHLGFLICLPNPELLHKWEYEISAILALVLALCVLVPAFNWKKWRFLLAEFECLSLRLSKGFQAKAPDEIDEGSTRNFPN